ncbi:PepSY domain-containing protein [uncultured Bacteroides sp.]|uniref:PepSY domain-containing protein n=1 Tax=uncultured Bacteroides sp. TaxID=162156 RepID=UPI002AA89A9D|nr:PepSY domain-containing protein [uncultured Bacteroides sp.]
MLQKKTSFFSRFMYSTHRVLGTLLSILFLMWFLTGLVLIYHTFPSANRKEKADRLEFISDRALPDIARVVKRIPGGAKIDHISVDRYLGQTLFHIQCGKQKYDLPADSVQQIPVIDGKRIAAVAFAWCKAPVARIDTLRKLDQWIPFGQLKKEFPIYKFYFKDKEKHQLYISSKSAEVLQFTSYGQRFWAWLGAIPHWVYFTSLRQDKDLWTLSVICLAIPGILMTISGIYVGIDAYVQRYKRKRTFSSPYKKKWYWWHHVTGMLFGIFVLTWIFSGMMSVVDTPQWVGKTHKEYPIDKVMASGKISPENYPLDYREVIKAYSGKVKSIEWDNFRDIPLYHIQTGKKKITLDASADTVRTLQLSPATVLQAVNAIQGSTVRKEIELLHQYDAYYIARSGHLPLPVYKITVNDADAGCYYINPATGEYRYVNTHSRWSFWLYQGMHSLKIKWLVNHPLVWIFVMWTLLIGGAIVSLSGVVLGIRYIVRKGNQLKA